MTQTPDVPLVEDIYALVGKLDDEDIYNEFHWLLTEAFERFAPNVELDLQRVRIMDGEGENWPDAFETYLKGRGWRHAARLDARAERQRKRDYGDA